MRSKNFYIAFAIVILFALGLHFVGDKIPDRPKSIVYEWQADYRYWGDKTTTRVGESDKPECPFKIDSWGNPDYALIPETCKTREKL